MSREDIQAFLEEKNSILARTSFDDASGTMRLPSDIIARSAALHRISPKYLLVKLQKEQSLVTDPEPTQKQFDWATGYGICDSCSMSDPTLQKYRGLANQIDSAGGIMRWYYDNAYISPIIKRPNILYSIDAVPVQPANWATAFLYTYTPHIHGNQNFWKLWQRWFEPLYPDGTLVKTPDDPMVYLIASGQKRPFVNYTALSTRFNPELIITVPASQLSRYPAGPEITIPNYSVLLVDGKYYLLNYDTIRPFADQSVVAKLGYNPDEIITASTTEIAGLTLGKPITAESVGSPFGALVHAKENNQLYYITDGVYQLVSHPLIAQNRFPNLEIQEVSITSLATTTPGTPLLLKDGTLMGSTLTNKIYVIERGRKRHIPTEEAFVALGYNLKNVLWVDEFTELNHPTGNPLSVPLESIENGPSLNPLMVSTPTDKAEYIGDKFETTVDTYLVADAQSGEILAGKNIDTVRPMASFAKIITAYRLLTTGLSQSKITTYRPNRDATLYNNFRVVAGERIKNSDLLDAMLVSSLNPPVNMLIANVDTDKNNFIKGLNTLVKKWGLTKTTFADAAGEDVKTQTTAREYLTLYDNTTNGKILPPILGKTSYRYKEIVDKDGNPNHFDSNTNLLMEKTDLPFRIVTSKTGYLDEAGAGLAMKIERSSDKKQFYVITMGNPDYAHRFDEPEKLARWAITTF